MSITVKKLISELQKIQNKYREVEVCLIDKDSLEPEIQSIGFSTSKVIIFLERKKGL